MSTPVFKGVYAPSSIVWDELTAFLSFREADRILLLFRSAARSPGLTPGPRTSYSQDYADQGTQRDSAAINRLTCSGFMSQQGLSDHPAGCVDTAMQAGE